VDGVTFNQIEHSSGGVGGFLEEIHESLKGAVPTSAGQTVWRKKPMVGCDRWEYRRSAIEWRRWHAVDREPI